MTAAAEPVFAFGKNWSRFLSTVSDRTIRHSCEKLAGALGDIRGKSFLDVGCGSGLHSLAAIRLGASRVHAFDFDVDSVECSNRLRTQYAPSSPWTIEKGSVLDEAFLRRLGKFDIVYAWGVLHHTAQMWKALDLVTIPVADRLFISIYNDRGFYSRCWRAVKRTHAYGPAAMKRLVELGVFGYIWGKHALNNCLHLRPMATLRSWREYGKSRGMSPWHDAVDWAGGYPFEVAKPEEILAFYRSRGFAAECLLDWKRGQGCNEFLLTRPK